MTRADPFQTTILAIDDTPDHLTILVENLRQMYRIKAATCGEDGLRMARSTPAPSLVLLDIDMPGLDGYEVCRRLKLDPTCRDIPVIFLTAQDQELDEELGFSVGAVDYITKPFSPRLLQARVATHLELKLSRDALKLQNADLEAEVRKRTRELLAVQDVTIQAMASLAETRDNETGNHIRRTQWYVRELARQLRTHPLYARLLDEPTIELLYKSAPLHDIGKVGIPDRILLKPGKFEPQEFEIMKKHTILGRDAIIAAEKDLDSPAPFLRFARQIAYSHQEKWDGTGYPEGLRGEQIPFAARLMAIADVYDALISRRVYKPPYPHEKAISIIQEGKGTHFDPGMVDAFLQIADRCRDFALLHADSHEDVERKANPESLKY